MLTASPHVRPSRRRRSAFGVVGLLVTALGLSVAPTIASAQTGENTLSVQPGSRVSAQVGPVFRDGFGLASFVVPAATARPLTVAVQFRGSSVNDGYRASLVIKSDGSLGLQGSRVSGGAEQVLSTLALPKRVDAGQRVTIQGWVHGSPSVLLRVRSWIDTQPKPDWQISYTDSSSAALQSAAVTQTVASLAGTASSGATLNLSTTMDREAGSPVPAPGNPPPPNPAPPNPAPVNPTSPGHRLSPSQVGVPSGTNLTAHYGDLVINQANTVIDRMDVHGIVYVRAPNVRITRSLIRGGASTYHVGMITAVNEPGLVVEDSDLRADNPSVKMDGILGNNYTVRRVHIQGGVDNVKIEGDNVRVESSLLDGLNHFAQDPSQNNGPSHNDAVQILSGRNIVITGTTALADDNFAILGGAEWGDVPGLVITNNYVDGGHCNIKLAVRNGHSESATVTGNTFGPHVLVRSCALVAEKAVNLSEDDNFAEADGRRIIALRI